MDYEASRLVTDISGLEQLKTQARQNPDGALGEVARQFESVLVGMMIRSMRQASFGGGLMDSQQSRMYQDLYDQQLAMELSQRGLGLADVICRQLGGDPGETAAARRDLPEYLAHPTPSAAPLRTARDPATDPDADGRGPPVSSAVSGGAPLDSPQRFVAALMPWAREAAAKIGIAPEALLAQAALETGWGRSVIHGSGGSNSHNLFGIKADGRWDGDQVAVTTLEYVDGIAVRRKDPFRTYASYRDSFRDYVQFLQDNPRYQEALACTADPAAYFSALQAAGYATDPQYANKVLRVMQSGEMQRALERLEWQAGADEVAGNPPANG
jgi:flagellar protein FlgJ